MIAIGTYRFVIESTQFAKLERALSVALPAARLMGAQASIFWLRNSIFAATPYASIGLTNFDIELRPERKTKDSPGCLAISNPVARRILSELRSHRVRYLEKIRLLATRDEVLFSFDYDSESKLESRGVASRYVGMWLPRLTPREHYELFTEDRSYFYCALSIEEVRAELREYENEGDSDSDARNDGVSLEDFPDVISHVTVSRSLLLAFFEAAKDEDTTFLFGYYDSRHPIVCRAGDVIAILSVID